jgi:hypothetical protein
MPLRRWSGSVRINSAYYDFWTKFSPHQNLCARFDIGNPVQLVHRGRKQGRPSRNHYAAMTYEGKAFAQNQPEIFRPKL